MAKSTAVPSLKIIGVATLPQAYPFVVHSEGTDDYAALRINGKVNLELDDGSKVEASVQGLQVGALIDLLGSTGPQSIVTYGRVYSALSLVQALTDASPDDVLDVTKLYTAVTVTVPQAPVPQIPQPAA
jgi:hypothetical protein